MNYVAIVIAPFIVDWAQDVIGVKGERFPFAFNALLGFVALLLLLILRVYKKYKEKEV
jgi:MFS family permease